MTEEAKDRFLGPTTADRRPASFSLVTARAVHNDYRRATIDNDDDFHHRPRSTTLSRPFRLPQIPKTNNTTTTESIPKSIYSPILSLSLSLSSLLIEYHPLSALPYFRGMDRGGRVPRTRSSKTSTSFLLPVQINEIATTGTRLVLFSIRS